MPAVLVANCHTQALDPEDYLVEVIKRLPHVTPGTSRRAKAEEAA